MRYNGVMFAAWKEGVLVRLAEIRLKAVKLWRRVKPGKLPQGSVVPSTAPVLASDDELDMTKARSRRLSKRSQFGRRLSGVRLVRFLALGSLLAVIGGIVLFFLLFAYYSRDLPKPGEVVRREGYSTRIYDRNGVLLYDLFDDERSVPIKIDQVPDYLLKATVAIEDKEFYNHKGFDWLTIVRIPYNLVFRQGRVVGGSTLTQQLVKNALLSNERSLPRKFKEFVLSLQIERTFTKEQILEMYLNETPYGGNGRGVGIASEMYYNKPASQLSLAEAIVLAGLPQRPTAYSPFSGRTSEDGTPLWKFRALGVARRMLEDKYLTQEQYDQVLADFENMQFQRGAVDIKAPHFVFYVRDLLEQQFGTEVAQAGYSVTTTLDWELQQQIEAIVKEELDKVANLNITNGAVLVMDPNTGEILSMVGSKDYNNKEIGGEYNVVVDGLRQPGSSIKPLTYLNLLRHGYTPASMLADVPTKFQAFEGENPYEPKNYDGTFRGPVSMRNSLGSSLNIPAVKALAIVGVEEFLMSANEMGLETLAPTEANLRRFGLAVTLGGAEVHMIDLVTAYSAFGNGGEKVESNGMLTVKDANGRTVYEYHATKGARVMEKGEAFLINNILSDNTARALAFGTNSLLNLGPGVAVKTGTTNEQRDNWAIGWSNSAIVGAWVGNNDNSQMSRVTSGVSGATPIWRRAMQAVLARQNVEPKAWEMPDDVEQVTVDTVSGYPATEGLPSRTDYVLKGTLPSLPDPIHTKIKVCKDDHGKLATNEKVKDGDYDEVEAIVMKEDDPVSTDGKNRWQEAIDAWVAASTDSRFKIPTEYCGEQNDVYVELIEPKDDKNYDDEKIDIKVKADASGGIKRIEIYVNDDKVKEVNGGSYSGTLELPAGKYAIRARAISNNDKRGESQRATIGTGGVKWNAKDSEETDDDEE